MDALDTKSLVLDISVNLSRIGRFVMANQTSRINQFSLDVSSQLTDLKTRSYPDSLNFAITKASQLIEQLTAGQVPTSPAIAEDFFTYSLILQHRSALIA